jgi:hypothetical protein
VRQLIGLSLVILFASSIVAQPVCLSNFPAESPVPSYSPDDVPKINAWDTITYTGALVKPGVNHNFAFVEVTPNDQRVWFGVDATAGTPLTFYNRRVRDNESSPWRWLYSSSPAVIEYVAPTSSGPGNVLYSATPRYYDSVSQHSYKFLLYLNHQPGVCNGVIAGFLAISFSDDGICWTPPRIAHRGGGPSFPCLPGETNTIPIEQITAIDSGGDLIWLVGVEGNIDELAPPMEEVDGCETCYTYRRLQNMERTQTYLGVALPANPGTIYLNQPYPELTKHGIYLPHTGPYNTTHGSRYQPYPYFINLQVAYDATSGDFYIGRGYPYPYDRGSAVGVGWTDPPNYPNTPHASQLTSVFLNGPFGSTMVEGCRGAPYTLPNRIQVYKMHIGPLSNIGQITNPNSQWTLVTDLGGPLGYAFHWWPYGGTNGTPLVYGQTNAGRDYGAVSFIRDGAGNLVRYGTTAYAFAGDTFMSVKGGAERCKVTGTERITAFTLP